MTTFAALTTLQVGGPITDLVTVHDDAEVVEALRDHDDALVLGGGSNLLVADAPFEQRVVRIATRGMEVQRDRDRVIVDVAAGESWDDFVAFTVEQGWSGVDALAGIPGLVGATPIQNVGAYGQEVAQVIDHVTVLDRRDLSIGSMSVAECDFGYRSSRFKREPNHFVVVSVAFVLDTSASEIRYAELARTLGVDVGASAPAERVREAVLELRRSKGMVLDAADPDTRSAGSFFTNPIVDAQTAAALAGPTFAADGGVKLSAAWLIEQAGITRGFSVGGRAKVSGKHALAITNATGDASAEEILDLARVIRDRVREATGVSLEPEPRLVGCSL